MVNPVDTQGTPETFVASELPAKNRYGQNGYQGPSSDLPGQHTTSGFLPQARVDGSKWQTRDVKKDQYPTTHGMRNRSLGPETIPAKTNRR